MKITLLAFVLLSLWSCSGKQSEIIPNENANTTNSLQSGDKFGDLRDFPSITHQENKDSLIAGMTEDNCVYEKSSGIAGDYTYAYACFDRLTKLISEKELFDLIVHPNPNVRLYAFNEIKRSQSHYLDSAKLILKDDHSRVWTLSGPSKKNIKLSDLAKTDPIDKIKSLEYKVENVAAESTKK